MVNDAMGQAMGQAKPWLMGGAALMAGAPLVAGALNAYMQNSNRNRMMQQGYGGGQQQQQARQPYTMRLPGA
jgi:hypothetical protein